MAGYTQSTKYIDEIKARGPVLEWELQEPIRGADGKETTMLSFREPTAGDIYEHGNPITRVDPMVTPFRVERDQVVYLDMMAALSGVPAPNLLRLMPNDLLAIEAQLDHFFIPGFRTRPSPGTKETSSQQDEQPEA